MKGEETHGDEIPIEIKPILEEFGDIIPIELPQGLATIVVKT